MFFNILFTVQKEKSASDFLLQIFRISVDNRSDSDIKIVWISKSW